MKSRLDKAEGLKAQNLRPDRFRAPLSVSLPAPTRNGSAGPLKTGFCPFEWRGGNCFRLRAVRIGEGLVDWVSRNLSLRIGRDLVPRAGSGLFLRIGWYLFLWMGMGVFLPIGRDLSLVRPDKPLGGQVVLCRHDCTHDCATASAGEPSPTRPPSPLPGGTGAPPLRRRSSGSATRPRVRPKALARRKRWRK